MGRLFLVDFKERETPATQYYVCRACRTHLVLFDDCAYHDVERGYMFFVNVINTFDGIGKLYPDGILVGISFCVKCNSDLGQKTLQWGNNRTANIRELQYLSLEKLLMKNGNYLYDAFNGELIQDA